MTRSGKLGDGGSEVRKRATSFGLHHQDLGWMMNEGDPLRRVRTTAVLAAMPLTHRVGLALLRPGNRHRGIALVNIKEEQRYRCNQMSVIGHLLPANAIATLQPLLRLQTRL
jgi:hypothetical protein